MVVLHPQLLLRSVVQVRKEREGNRRPDSSERSSGYCSGHPRIYRRSRCRDKLFSCEARPLPASAGPLRATPVHPPPERSEGGWRGLQAKSVCGLIRYSRFVQTEHFSFFHCFFYLLPRDYILVCALTSSPRPEGRDSYGLKALRHLSAACGHPRCAV